MSFGGSYSDLPFLRGKLFRPTCPLGEAIQTYLSFGARYSDPHVLCGKLFRPTFPSGQAIQTHMSVATVHRLVLSGTHLLFYFALLFGCIQQVHRFTVHRGVRSTRRICTRTAPRGTTAAAKQTRAAPGLRASQPSSQPDNQPHVLLCNTTRFRVFKIRCSPTLSNPE